MAEASGQERTEEPTDKKISESRKKGQVARSKELGTTFVLIFSAIALLLYGPSIAKGLYNIMGRGLSLNRNETYDTTKMFSVRGEMFSELFFPMAMFVFIISIAGIVGNTLLGGFNFNSYDIKARVFSSNLFKKFTISSDSMFLNIFHEFLFKAAQEVKN